MPKINIPGELLCPITYKLFKEPVTIDDGHTYEKHAVEKWIKDKGTSPKTHKKISNQVTPNHHKKHQLVKFLKKNEICTPGQFLSAINMGKESDIEKLNYTESHLEIQTRDGLTPLHYAIYNRSKEATAWLLSAKVKNKETKDNDGWTPLHYAIIYSCVETIKLLLGAKDNLEIQDGDGWTPLHWAVSNDDQEAVKLLLDNGANCKAIDKIGKTPIAMAQDSGKASIVKLLLDYCRDKQKELIDIRKAARLLAQLYRNNNFLLQVTRNITLPIEVLCDIASLCRNTELHAGAEAKKIASAFFCRP